MWTTQGNTPLTFTAIAIIVSVGSIASDGIFRMTIGNSGFMLLMESLMVIGFAYPIVRILSTAVRHPLVANK